MANNVESTYDSSALGSTLKIRLRAAEGAIYTAGAATADFDLHVYGSGSRRRFGVHPRGVRLTRLAGVAPEQTVKRTFLAFGTEAALDAVALNSVIAIGGVDWRVASKVPEDTV